MTDPAASFDQLRIDIRRISRTRRAWFWCEGLLTVFIYGLFAALSPGLASAIGGWFGEKFGPTLRISRLARANMATIMPDLSPAEIDELTRKFWRNLGRVAGEFPHLRAIARRDVELFGADIVERLLAERKPIIFVSAHLANWELMPSVVAALGIPLRVITKARANRLSEWIVRRGRMGTGVIPVGSGPGETLRVARALSHGAHVSLVVDQTKTQGVFLPFLGHPARTPTSPAVLALRFGCAIVPTRIERLHGTRHRMTFYPPMALPGEGPEEARVNEIMTAVNDRISAWIRERPDQWMWFYRKWTKLVVDA